MKPATEGAKWTEGGMLSLLRSHHGDSRKWAFLTKVADATGFGCSGWCDALAMSLWPSQGLYLWGYEVKVSRSDWTREIQNVAKAEKFSDRCHYWMIAAPPGIVKREELPATWGLIEPAGSGMKVRRPPTRQTPEPVSWNFLAAILRYAVAQSPHADFVKAECKKARDEGERYGRESAMRSVEENKGEASRLAKNVAAFEEASGISIDSYHGKRIGDAVRLIQSVGLDDMRMHLKWVGDYAKHVQEKAALAIDALDGKRLPEEAT